MNNRTPDGGKTLTRLERAMTQPLDGRRGLRKRDDEAATASDASAAACIVAGLSKLNREWVHEAADRPASFRQLRAQSHRGDR
jgi:hypothetical protein